MFLCQLNLNTDLYDKLDVVFAHSSALVFESPFRFVMRCSDITVNILHFEMSYDKHLALKVSQNGKLSLLQ